MRYSKSNAAVITIADAMPKGSLVPLGRVIVRERVLAARPSPAARLAYYATLEEALLNRIRQDRRTDRLLRFNLVVDVRIDDDGQLAWVRVDRGTGVKAFDLILIDLLAGTAVPEPPDGLVQPLRLSLKGRRR